MMLFPHLVTAIMVVGSLLLSIIAAGSSSPESSEALSSGASGSSGSSHLSSGQIPGKGNSSSDDVNQDEHETDDNDKVQTPGGEKPNLLGIGKVPSHAERMLNRDEIIEVFRQGLHGPLGIRLREDEDPETILINDSTPPPDAFGLFVTDSCNRFSGTVNIADDGVITLNKFLGTETGCSNDAYLDFSKVFFSAGPKMIFRSGTEPGIYWVGTADRAIEYHATNEPAATAP